MEELKSTEVLDREILEDARKKAHRILKTADESLGSQGRIWEKRIRRALETIRKTYAERIKKNQEETLARLPLDKRRLRSETAEGFLLEAMDKFLSSLPRDKILSILENELSPRLKACAESAEGAKAEFLYSGMDRSEALGILGRILGPPSANWDLREGLSDFSAVHKFPSIIVNTQAMRVSASVESAAAAIMKEKRAELAAALMGGEVLND